MGRLRAIEPRWRVRLVHDRGIPILNPAAVGRLSA
jgi:hypothetical protein